MTRLLYRGVSYDNSRHEQLPAAPLEHTYRGQHYNASIRHEAADVDLDLELHYRGHSYHHQAPQPQR